MPEYAYNKKLKRAVKYDDLARVIFTIDDKGELEYVATVGIEEAHRWLHGTEQASDAGALDIDQMLEAIAIKLQNDVTTIMLKCASDEGYLNYMHELSKSDRRPAITPAWR